MNRHTEPRGRTEATDPPESTEWPPWTCPQHHVALQEAPDSLNCPEGHSFPVQKGIPRFVPSSNYADSFGIEWNHFLRTQLDSYTGCPITRRRLRRSLGEDLWKRLPGMTVLEAGCGAGRFTEVLLSEGARVVSIDISSAADANVDNCPVGAHHRVAQADILEPPFPEGRFDLVLCLGVLQHTPSTRRSLESLSRQVRPGGWLVVDHYTRWLDWHLRSHAYFRLWYRRLPPERALARIHRLVNRWLPRLESARRVRLRILNRLVPVIHFTHDYPELELSTRREWALLETFDQLTDHHKRFWSHRRLRKHLDGLGLEEIWVSPTRKLEARARKGAGAEPPQESGQPGGPPSAGPPKSTEAPL